MHYKAVLIYVGEVLQNNVKNKLIVETPLKRIIKGVALSEVWAVDTAWLKRSSYIIGSLSNNDGDGYEHVTSKVNHAASSFITLISLACFSKARILKCCSVFFFFGGT